MTTVNSSMIVLPEECARSVMSSNLIEKRRLDKFVENHFVLRKISFHNVIKKLTLDERNESFY